MIEARYSELQDVIAAAEFPELDLALRRGRHIDREDFALFTLLVEGQEHLEAFYRRFGCELVHKTDGYFYLLPTGDKLSRRQLTPGDMLVGQALALLYLAPSTIEHGGRITQEDVVAQLVVVLGSDTLMHAFNPKQKRKLDERIAQKNVRARIGEGIRHLAALGFVDVADDDSLRLRPSLLRFAEPVRGLSEPAEALAKLVATGEVSLVPEEADEIDAVDAAIDIAARDDDDDIATRDDDDDDDANDVETDDDHDVVAGAVEALESGTAELTDRDPIRPSAAFDRKPDVVERDQGKPATATATVFASLLSSPTEPARPSNELSEAPTAGDQPTDSSASDASELAVGAQPSKPKRKKSSALAELADVDAQLELSNAAVESADVATTATEPSLLPPANIATELVIARGELDADDDTPYEDTDEDL